LAEDEEAVATAKVHRWLALDQGQGPEVVRREVEAWETTALPARFEMARLLLLRQDHSALMKVRQLVDDGTLTTSELASWPIFDRVRKAGLLDGYLEKTDA
jgi:hypothetical protein